MCCIWVGFNCLFTEFESIVMSKKLLKLGIACPWGFSSSDWFVLRSKITSYWVKNKSKQPRFRQKKAEKEKCSKDSSLLNKYKWGNCMDREHKKEKFQDQGVGKFGFFWGLSLWLAYGHLTISSHGLSSVCIYLCCNLL